MSTATRTLIDIPIEQIKRLEVVRLNSKRQTFDDRLSIAMFQHAYKDAPVQELDGNLCSTEACWSPRHEYCYYVSFEIHMKGESDA